MIKNSGYDFKYTGKAMNDACSHNHINVLEWFKNSGYDFKYTEKAMNDASYYGYIQVLEWFKYNEDAIIYAYRNNEHIKVFEWFNNSGYEIEYYETVINDASFDGNIKVLEWFKNSKYKFKYTKNALKTRFIKILKFYSNTTNIKKLIKWSSNIFIKTIKFKNNNKYLKGYQKN